MQNTIKLTKNFINFQKIQKKDGRKRGGEGDEEYSNLR